MNHPHRPVGEGAAADVARLNDVLAVVTGAGRGIGRTIAMGLAGAGARVVLVARNVQQLEAVRTAIGPRAYVVPADVSSPDEVERLRTAVADIGTATVLVNAAGMFGPLQLISQTEPREWIRTVEVNTFGPYLTSRAFVPGMIAAGWGRILNLTSAAALHTPGPFNSAYATSKAGLNQFTRHLAAELRGTGVTANVFHPGDVKTEMWAAIKDQVAALGADASDNYGPWVEWVDRTGGDPPQKAVDLVLGVITSTTGPNGAFLWIDNPLQPTISAWETEGSGRKPSYATVDPDSP
jgi:NAD(P)-dependent dehydrogenase (short-subunit alcohol dehydrogenase family)